MVIPNVTEAEGDDMRVIVFTCGVVAVMGTLMLVHNLRADNSVQKDEDEWTSDFTAEKDHLTSTGRNPFFILEPGYQLVLEGGNERLTVTVLDDTKMVDGVETRVVEER